MQNVSGFGTSVTIVALKTFPMGFTITQFADDVMPLQFSEVQVGDHEFLVDGELFSFDTSAAISVKLGVIAGTEDDSNLGMLTNSKKGTGIIPFLPDTIIMTVNYPNQSPIILSNGYVRTGYFGNNINEQGKMTGKTYELVFGECTPMTLSGLLQAGLSAVTSFLGD